jgi:membrane protein involved in colicin uptake
MVTVLVLLLGSAAALGVVYANARSRHDSLTTQLSDKDKELWGSTKKVLDGNDELKKAREAEQTAEDAQKKAEDIGAVRVKCQEAARALREATLTAPDLDKINDAANRLLASC